MIHATANRVAVEAIPPVALSEVLWVPGAKTTFDRNVAGEVEAKTRGRVVSKGPKCRMDFEVGDIVQFSDSCSNAYFEGNTEYRIFREDDILGVEE